MPLRRDRTKVLEPLEWAFPPAPISQREILSRLPAEDTGKPPLLFVHGLSHAAWCWDEHWMPAAAERGWPCYAVSLRGHGGSEGHERIRRWTLRDYEHDVLQAIIELPSPPVLIGHSMGALIVQRVLERYPARAGVLVTPAGNRHGFPIFAGLAGRKPLQALRALTLQPVRLDADDLFSDRLDRAVAQAHAERLTDESPLAQCQIVLPRRAHTARCPVMVIGAGDDRLVPPVEAALTARRYGTRAHMFRGMGHDPMLDAGWQAPLELMLGWLDRTLGT